MPKTALKKEKWTLSFDPRLKRLLIKEARKKGVYPVNLLESDDAFLDEIREWQKSRS